MRITTRAGWGARPPADPPVHVDPTHRQYFVVHHSGGPPTQTVRAIQDWCMGEPPHGRGFADIDYNHLVRGTTGEIYEGRGFDTVGSHTANYNTAGYGVCIIGAGTISDAAKRSVVQLHQLMVRRAGHPLKVRGHRDLATTGTTCPGDHIYSWVKAGMPTPKEDDVELTDAQIDRIADRAADKVWAETFGNTSTEARWPGSGTKSMKAFVALAAMGAKDAAKGIASLAVKDLVDEPALAAELLPMLGADQLATLIRKGMTPEERHALADQLKAD